MPLNHNNRKDMPLIQNMRRNYTKQELIESTLPDHPFDLFDSWFHDAVKYETVEPNAMVLATASKSGIPSARVVLLKEYDKNGFVFFTNYLSKKGKEMEANPFAALVFHWNILERQVRITGRITKVSREETESYFRSRPRESQISALISPQSNLLETKDTLKQEAKAVEEQYTGKDIPVPENWGGYRVEPDSIEFWQGGPYRLHDRILYQFKPSGWGKTRLAP